MARWILAALILFTVVRPATAQETVRFVTIETPPWAYLNGGGEQAGMFVRIVREVMHRTGLEAEMRFVPFARVGRELEAGSQDCTILAKLDAFAHALTFGELVWQIPLSVIARKGVSLQSYDDLKDRRISVLRSLSISPRFDTDPDILREIDTDYLRGLKKVTAGRIHAIAGAGPTIRHVAREHNLEQFLGDELTLSMLPLHLQCSNLSPVLFRLDDMNRAIQEMVKDGTIDRIVQTFCTG